MGLSVALMLYCKYHGLLVVILTVLSHVNLLRSARFYLAMIIAFMLFVPHLWWQYNHHFITFQYHLQGRISGFTSGHIFEYISQQIIAIGPCLFIIPFIKTKDQFERTLKFIAAGAFIFFLIASFKTFIHLHWTSIALYPLIYLATGFVVQKLLDSLYNIIQKKNVAECAVDFTKNYVEKMHNSLAIDDSAFTMRYQTYVLRFMEPVQIFKNIIVAFEAANRSPLIVGVNIVAPEHENISMSDYWLHMQMFNFCHTIFPNVKYSLHAGELTLGMVKPEDLTWHINSAVYDAKANRVGHGVDIAYEKDPYKLLNFMSKKNIAVEMNLYSNEFILKVKDDRHPIMLYKKFKVPIVISTDDAGILRSNLTEQFVLLAKRYKQLKFADIKQFVYNSIQYSFIKEPRVKQKLISQLDRDFKTFENNIIAIQKK